MRDIMKVDGIGIDIAEIDRFRTVIKEKKDHFLENTFSITEQAYCFSYRDPAPHFAGMFAAKEATRKATGDISESILAVEVRHTKTGKPEIWVKGKRTKSILVSITHSQSIACAVAIMQKS